VGDDQENSVIDEQQLDASGEKTAASEPEALDGAESEKTAPAVDDELAVAQQSIEDLTQQLSDSKDQQLRIQAEMQNLRRRAERDVQNAHKYGLEKLINALLPVLDNLDRTISAADADEAADNTALKSLLEGVELTSKSATDALKNFSVEIIDPVGEPFDPQLHEAMTMVPSPSAEPNTVIDVLQKGYTLNGRLLRAAMVVVAKATE